MSRGFSIYLDLVRFLAAILVLLSHFAYPRFTDGDYLTIRTLNLGSDAVVVFFVLSGLVIASAAERDGSAGRFAFRRATRLLSVVAPALAITLLFDSFGAWLNPAAYDGWWYNAVEAWEVLLYGLSFSNEWSFAAIRLGTNGPFWSLSYEAGYYLLFGAAIFTSGWRRVALLAGLALLVGSRILLLMPVWVFGVLVWRVIAAGRGADTSRRLSLALAIGCPVVYAVALAVGLPGMLMDLTQTLATHYQVYPTLRFSDEFLWNTLIGALVAYQFIGMVPLLAQATFGRLGISIRWLAGASFSIYVIHYPALQLVDAALPETLPLRHLVLLASVLAICFLFAQLFERRLSDMRRAVIRMVTRPVQAPARR